MSSRTSHGAVPHDDPYLTTSTVLLSSAPAWATFFLTGRKRRRVEPHAFVVVFGVLRVLRVLEDNNAIKINTIEDEKPPSMGEKAPIYGVKSPRLWGKPLFMGILKNKGFL